MSSAEEKIKSFLSDLGKATLRGVRRCPRCGTYNGTRGLSCKNKKCNAVFREKRKFNSEACKLVTGNSTQVYSVRVRDKGPECRGFVQLPLIQTQVPGASTVINSNFSGGVTDTALCFVESCQQLFDASILKCHEEATGETCLISSMCQHIEAAMKCESEASALTLRNSVLSSLSISNSVKQDIYLLASQTPGPLVQRVSKNVMVVKCLVSAEHPLGYLHFSFFFSKAKEKNENRYRCSCTDFRNGINGSDETPRIKKCIHLYACLCAFASDPKLSEEFADFIGELSFNIPRNGFPLSLDTQFGLILDQETGDFCNIEVEVDRQLLGVPVTEAIDSSVHVQDLHISPDGEVTIISGIDDDGSGVPFGDLPDGFNTFPDTIDVVVNTIDSPLTIKRKKPLPIRKKSSKTTSNVEIRSKGVGGGSKKFNKNIQSNSVEEKRTNLPFIEWLASVTERINQTMHYQFNGHPEPLVFHISQTFFDCLRERISFGGIKKRLPNYTDAFVRKDALPLGTFTKYTWHITNILHVIQIFETPLVPLQITKSFIQNRDGTFEEYIPKGDEQEGLRNDGLVPIKPSELKTYLKVGNTLQNQVEPTPFIIEWIPDVLPLTKVGELRIRFEYGHQQGVCLPKPLIKSGNSRRTNGTTNT